MRALAGSDSSPSASQTGKLENVTWVLAMPVIDQDLSGCDRQKCCCSAVTCGLALTAHSACAGLKCQAVTLLPSLADWTRTRTIGTVACNSCQAQTSIATPHSWTISNDHSVVT